MSDAFLAHNEEHAGHTIKIYVEEYVEEWMNPRADYDGNLGVMIASYDRYILGGGPHDEDEIPDFEIKCSACHGSGAIHGPENVVDGFLVALADCPVCEGEGRVEVDPATWARETHGARVVLPLFIYDHSGISMSTGRAIKTAATARDFDPRGHNPFDSAAWDTSVVGLYFDTAETREACGWEERTDEEIEEELEREIELYNAYLQGQVYTFVIENDEEPVDACGGFLETAMPWTDEAYVLQEARGAAENAAKEADKEQAERFAMACRDIDTKENS